MLLAVEIMVALQVILGSVNWLGYRLGLVAELCTELCGFYELAGLGYLQQPSQPELLSNFNVKIAKKVLASCRFIV